MHAIDSRFKIECMYVAGGGVSCSRARAPDLERVRRSRGASRRESQEDHVDQICTSSRVETRQAVAGLGRSQMGTWRCSTHANKECIGGR